jgi:protein-S-isoprenylcysteine O-methyltransferase Ste14
MTPDIDLIARLGLGLIFAGAAVIGFPHRLRADRAGGKVSIRGDPAWFWRFMLIAAPALLLACIIFLINPRWMDWSAVPLPPWLRLAGLILALPGLGLFKWMFVHLGHNVTSTSVPRSNATLVTTGPYRWVRHPMYTSAHMLYLAVSLLTANWFIAACAAAGFALLAARTRIEEQRLIEQFGDAYRDYMRATGRFLPRLRRKGTG